MEYIHTSNTMEYAYILSSLLNPALQTSLLLAKIIMYQIWLLWITSDQQVLVVCLTPVGLGILMCHMNFTMYSTGHIVTIFSNYVTWKQPIIIEKKRACNIHST